jgi:hypothetical protein
MRSFFLRLSKNDLFKGFVVAFIAAVGTVLIPMLDAGTLPDLAVLKASVVTGLTAGLAYLLKNLLTNSNGEILKKEPVQ